MAGDDGVVADARAVHHGGIDADQAAVADLAAVQRDMVGDRAVLADHGGRVRAHVDHDEILQVGAGADADLGHLAAHDHVRPNRGPVAHVHLAVQLGGGMQQGEGFEGDVLADVRQRQRGAGRV
ncbi:MAG: hypothetical protein ACK56I_12575, partial [bacterium]